MGYQYKTLFQSRLCLRFVSLKLNHSDADDYCKANGARLVRAKTQDVINVVTEGQGDFVWVGADDIAVEAEHHWNDGTPLLLNDTLWGTDEGVRSDEECVAVNPSKELADLQCSREHPFVCQMQM
ncbi:hypothetical protein BaRGS_00017624 [Batillaria attramentaria]|uniref:C-type lectin domain-containing protein n=1 Tax=Batillaria attramentaria TaxID=370345 RepID=A0ABD0KWQ9_9CAEN